MLKKVSALGNIIKFSGLLNLSETLGKGRGIK